MQSKKYWWGGGSTIDSTLMNDVPGCQWHGGKKFSKKINHFSMYLLKDKIIHNHMIFHKITPLHVVFCSNVEESPHILPGGVIVLRIAHLPGEAVILSEVSSL